MDNKKLAVILTLVATILTAIVVGLENWPENQADTTDNDESNTSTDLENNS